MSGCYPGPGCYPGLGCYPGFEDDSPGSWYTLIGILAEARDYQRMRRELETQACPNDGEPLLTGPDGRLYCRYDGWRPDGDYIPPAR